MGNSRLEKGLSDFILLLLLLDYLDSVVVILEMGRGFCLTLGFNSKGTRENLFSNFLKIFKVTYKLLLLPI